MKRFGSIGSVLAMAITAAACSSYGSNDDRTGGDNGSSGSTPAGPDAAAPADPKANAPDAPVGPPPPSEVTEQFGYFVAESGSDDGGDGSRAKPFASIGNALSKATVDGKRIYVCQGKYLESVAIANGVSMIGGYDCSNPSAWTNGSKRSTIASPTSPALTAKDVTSATRFERFEVTAPNGSESSPNSFGLVAENASGLAIGNTRIASGDAANGADGKAGIQLVPAGSFDGHDGNDEGCSFRAPSGVCLNNVVPASRPGGAGGVGACQGAPGHDGGKGGEGGPGAVVIGDRATTPQGQVLFYFWRTIDGATAGVVKSGAAGASGADGASATAPGTFSAAGFTPADGTVGRDGAPGEGGAGGDGSPMPQKNATANDYGSYWTSKSGGGGGAGGCPGLAGGAGKGGGASVAVLLVNSAVTFDKSELVSGSGGNGGRGSAGSKSTAGGDGGALYAVGGAPGGRGGESGISGAGAGGSSHAIVRTGAEPKLTMTTLKPGRAGAGVPQDTSVDGKIVPASADGEASETKTF